MASVSGDDCNEENLMKQGITPYGIFVRVLRTRVTIEFEDPFTQKITEELLIINDGDEEISDIPIPLPEPRNGIRVIDENDSLLPFLPHSEILRKLSGFNDPISNGLRSYLEDGKTIIWIQLQKDKALCKGETRIVRLNYWPTNPSNPQKQNYSLFGIPLYIESYAKGSNSNFDTFYLIKPPKNYIVSLKDSETQVENSKKEKLYMKPHVYDKVNLNDSVISITKRDSFINIRFPPMVDSYKAKIAYELKLPKNEHRFWKYLTPLSLIVLSVFVFGTFDNDYINTWNILSIKQGSIYALAGIVATVAGAVIALFHNPLILRIKLILFIDIALVLLLLTNVNKFPV